MSRMSGILNYRYMFLRRATSIGTLVLFFGANAYGWTLLKGNLSYADLIGGVPMADPFHVLQVLASMQVPAAEALTGAVVVLVFYAAVAGRAFCSWVCPVNMVSDAAGWLRRKTGFMETLKMSRSTRYWAVGLSLALSALMGIAAFEWISPVSMLHRGIVFGMGAGWAAVVGVFLFDSLVVRNGFCGHLCPLGGFYSIAGRYSLLRPAYTHDKCTNCARCTDVCPEIQVLSLVGKQSGRVASGECTNCGRCIEVCADKALAFTMSYDNTSANNSSSSAGGRNEDQA